MVNYLPDPAMADISSSLESEPEPGASYLLSEKQLAHPAIPYLLGPCPTVELTAIPTKDDQVTCYRRNGQKVFAVNQRKLWKIQRTAWKPNGHGYAMAWSEGVIRLLSPDSGKVVKSIKLGTTADFTHLSWTTTYINPERAGKRAKRQAEEAETGGLFSPEFDLQETLDHLSHALFNLRPQDALPKLPVTVGGHGEDDIFGTRTAMDKMFHPARKADEDDLDLLLAATADGKLHLSILDGFEVGGCPVGGLALDEVSGRVIHTAGTPVSLCHSLLVSQPGSGLSVCPVDFRFIAVSGDNLRLLATHGSEIRNLFKYIQQTHSLIEADWKSSLDLAKKFIRNVDEDLMRDCSCTLQTAAYHLAVTGDCYPALKNWLVEGLQERGQKRWEKAVTAGFESMRKLIVEQLLPATERTLMLVGRLTGLSRHSEVNATLGIDSDALDLVLQGLSCLHMLCYTTLTRLGIELSQFQAFAHWMRHEITMQATSQREEPEKDPGIQYRRVLDYIAAPMMRSELTELFDSKKGDEGYVELDPKMMKRQMEIALITPDEEEGCTIPGRIPTFSEVIEHLNHSLQSLFGGIAKRQQRNILFGNHVLLDSRPLHPAAAHHTDMITLNETTEPTQLTTYTLVPAMSPGAMTVVSHQVSRVNMKAASVGHVIGFSVVRLEILAVDHRAKGEESTLTQSQSPVRSRPGSPQQQRSSQATRSSPATPRSKRTIEMFDGAADEEQEDEIPRSQLTASYIAQIRPSGPARVRCARFFSPTEIIILVHHQAQSYLVILPFNPVLCPADSCALDYLTGPAIETPTAGPGKQSGVKQEGSKSSAGRASGEPVMKALEAAAGDQGRLLLTGQMIQRYAKVVLADDEGFIPEWLEVRFGTRNITILGKGGLEVRSMELAA